jgi:hypothetical protein
MLIVTVVCKFCIPFARELGIFRSALSVISRPAAANRPLTHSTCEICGRCASRLRIRMLATELVNSTYYNYQQGGAID